LSLQVVAVLVCKLTVAVAVPVVIAVMSREKTLVAVHQPRSHSQHLLAKHTQSQSELVALEAPQTTQKVLMAQTLYFLLLLHLVEVAVVHTTLETEQLVVLAVELVQETLAVMESVVLAQLDRGLMVVILTMEALLTLLLQVVVVALAKTALTV
jgi:hypothetical protein